AFVRDALGSEEGPSAAECGLVRSTGFQPVPCIVNCVMRYGLKTRAADGSRPYIQARNAVVTSGVLCPRHQAEPHDLRHAVRAAEHVSRHERMAEVGAARLDPGLHG